MFKENFIKLCNKKGVAPSKACRDVGLAPATFSCWNEDSVPRQATLLKIADYFGVTVDYLLGKEEEKPPAEETASEEEVKVALFGGSEEVTDEMWEEVKNFAEYVKQKYNKK